MMSIIEASMNFRPVGSSPSNMKWNQVYIDDKLDNILRVNCLLVSLQLLHKVNVCGVC